MLVNTEYEILTPAGFKPFDGIQISKHDRYLKITTSNQVLSCSLDHKLIMNGELILAKFLEEGSELLPGEIVWKLEEIEDSIELFDLINVDHTHTYYTNNLISHNCDCDFLSSGATVIDPEILTWYEENLIKDPIEKRGITGDLWIWKYPEYSKTYIIPADVARGDGSDKSAFHVLDIETLEVVAEFKGLIDPGSYGRLLISVGVEYNNAMLIIENTGVGYATIQTVLDLKYDNLYHSYKTDAYIDENIHLAKNYDLKSNKDKTPGFTTSHVIRPMLVSKLDLYFRERAPIIHSKRFMAELRVFIWKNNRGEAQQGYNDDLVMAFGIGLFLRDTAIRLRQLGIEMTKKVLNAAHKSVYRPSNSVTDPFKYTNSKGGKENLRWLL